MYGSEAARLRRIHYENRWMVGDFVDISAAASSDKCCATIGLVLRLPSSARLSSSTNRAPNILVPSLNFDNLVGIKDPLSINPCNS